MTLIQSVTVEGGRPGPELVCSVSPKPMVTFIRQVMCSRRLDLVAEMLLMFAISHDPIIPVTHRHGFLVLETRLTA